VSGFPPLLTDASPGLRAACFLGCSVDSSRRPVPSHTVPSHRISRRIFETENSDDRPALLVSACLLGVHCNHEAGHSRRPAVEALATTHRLVPICPEVCGGLSTPRPAAERRGDRVVNVDGDDVTDAYERGALAAVELARAIGATRAVLKARSPSCGTAQIYDGTFSRTLHAGEGVTAAALRTAGVEVISDDDLPT
jgi:uncharacterized protein YbbK (DUF523 family)